MVGNTNNSTFPTASMMARSAMGSTVMKMAPKIEPRILPSPPIMIIARKSMVVERSNCSYIAIPDSDEGPAHWTTYQIHREDDGQADDDEVEVVLRPQGAQDPGAKSWFGHIDGRLGAAADPGDVDDEPFDDELRRQGGNSEVQALDP